MQVDAGESERVEGMVEQQLDGRAPEALAPVAILADEDVQLRATMRPVDLTQVTEADEPIVPARAEREVAGLLGPRRYALELCPLGGETGRNERPDQRRV